MRKTVLLGTLVAALLGAFISTIVGYLVYAAPGDAVGFTYWLSNPIRMNVFMWAFVGLLAGVGLRYVIATR